MEISGIDPPVRLGGRDATSAYRRVPWQESGDSAAAARSRLDDARRCRKPFGMVGLLHGETTQNHFPKSPELFGVKWY